MEDRSLNLAPASVADYRELARRNLPRQLFDYIDGGAYKEATMRGFYIFSYASRFNEAYRRLGALINSGELRYSEDVLTGVEALPNALIRVLSGDNFGTQLVKFGED